MGSTLTSRPPIFVSAVSRELHSARQIVCNTLQQMGYEPVWQDVFHTDQGDLRAMLRRRIDDSKGVVHLVGRCYGAEPPTVDDDFDRVSYTQYEALYARTRNKPVWMLIIEDDFPVDDFELESSDLIALQDQYRSRILAGDHVYYPIKSVEGLESRVFQIRDELHRLRAGTQRWMSYVAAMLALIVIVAAFLTWQNLRTQSQLADVLGQINNSYAMVEGDVRLGDQSLSDREVDEKTLTQLAEQYGLGEEELSTQLREFSGRRGASGQEDSAFAKANVAFRARAYEEAERLALDAASQAHRIQPRPVDQEMNALIVAGLSAYLDGRVADAIVHFRSAKDSSVRESHPDLWLKSREWLAYLLYSRGEYAESGALYREVVAANAESLGPEHTETLEAKSNLGMVLGYQYRLAEAETLLKSVLDMRLKVMDENDPVVLLVKRNLAMVYFVGERYTDAETNFRHVYHDASKALGRLHPLTIECLYWLNLSADWVRLNSDRPELGPDDFEPGYRDALARCEEANLKDTWLIARICSDLAYNLFEQEKYADAEPFAERAVAGLRESRGSHHGDTLQALDTLALVLLSQDQLEDAAEVYAEIAEHALADLQSHEATWLAALKGLAACLGRLGRTPEAAAHVEDARNRAMLEFGSASATTRRLSQLHADLAVQDTSATVDEGG